MTDAAIDELITAAVPVTRACAALGRPRATHYRRHPVTPRPVVHGPPTPRRAQPRALSPDERQQVLDVLHEPRFVDKAPAQVWAEPLDDDVYLCSISSMYRLLAAAGETRERRRQATHPAHVKPELVADAIQALHLFHGLRPEGRGSALPAPRSRGHIHGAAGFA